MQLVRPAGAAGTAASTVGVLVARRGWTMTASLRGMSAGAASSGQRLFVISGLPATGKSSIARALARELAAPYLRVDTIEATIARAEGAASATNGWELPPGYAVAQSVAADQLRLGLDVVSESVNAVAEARDGWQRVGEAARVAVVEVEIICSDRAEHRRRAEQRVSDVPGLTLPTWEQITSRDYEPWQRDHLIVDTAGASIEDAVGLIQHAAR